MNRLYTQWIRRMSSEEWPEPLYIQAERQYIIVCYLGRNLEILFCFFYFFSFQLYSENTKALLGNRRYELFYFYLLLLCILKRKLKLQKCPWVTNRFFKCVEVRVFGDVVKEIRKQLKIFDQRSWRANVWSPIYWPTFKNG